MRFGAPEPLGIWAQLRAAGSNLAASMCAGPELGTARSRRVKDARRSLAGPPSAVLAGSLRVAHFGVRSGSETANSQNADIESLPDLLFCYIPR